MHEYVNNMLLFDNRIKDGLNFGVMFDANDIAADILGIILAKIHHQVYNNVRTVSNSIKFINWMRRMK
jgi:hypothetical protein